MACLGSSLIISLSNHSNETVTKQSYFLASSSLSSSRFVIIPSPSLLSNKLRLRLRLPQTRISPSASGLVVRASASSSETMATDKLGIKIITNPPESKLTELGVRSWPKWGCPPSKFPWTYSSKETCYLLKGKVKVYPDGCKDDEGVEIGAGDLVVFPKGMSCTWDVSETVDKHYNFE